MGTVDFYKQYEWHKDFRVLVTRMGHQVQYIKVFFTENDPLINLSLSNETTSGQNKDFVGRINPSDKNHSS